jgi:hypothetical protein
MEPRKPSKIPPPTDSKNPHSKSENPQNKNDKHPKTLISEKPKKRSGKMLWKKLRNMLLHKKNYVGSEHTKSKSIIKKKMYVDHNQYTFDSKLSILISNVEQTKFDKDYFLSLNKKDKGMNINLFKITPKMIKLTILV